MSAAAHPSTLASSAGPAATAPLPGSAVQFEANKLACRLAELSDEVRAVVYAGETRIREKLIEELRGFGDSDIVLCRVNLRVLRDTVARDSRGRSVVFKAVPTSIAGLHNVTIERVEEGR